MSFDAKEIQLQIFSPNLQNPITDPLFVTVNNEVEIFSSDFNVIQSSLVQHSFDITSDSVFYQVSPSTGSGNFGSGSFNGYVISDVLDVLPAIENVTIDFSATTLGIDDEDIFFNENEIFFNVEGLSFTPGDTVKLNVDFASQFNSVIRGTKWNDLNGNGSRNNNEPGLSGVQIYLDTNNNGILDSNEPVTTTDQSGNYEFTGLEAGTYIVREVIPQSFVQTFPLGSETNSVGDGFADVILDYFNSGAGTFDEPYGSDNSGNFPVQVSTDIILGSDENGALSLPTGSFVTVGFTDEIILDNPGNDIFIPEVGAQGEQAEVFVSSDGENFVFLGTGNGGVTSSFDLADINFTEPVQAVKIVGLDNGGGSPGFDVINVQGLPGSIVSPDFHTIELAENEIVESIDFGNFRNTIETEIPDEPNNQGRSKGEPHLTTFDGVGYDFQGAGEFTLVESNNGDIDVQIRYVQIDSVATVATAIATEVEGQTVVIDSEGIEFDDNGIPFVTRSNSGGTAKVTIDGVEVDINSGSSIAVGNSRIYRSSGEEYTIVFAGDDGIVNDGDDQLVVNYLRPGTINIVDVFLGNEYQGQLTGLLGNLNNNPDDDIALPNGDILPRPLPFDRLYGDYADAYRIKTVSESFFNYEVEQNPDTFYNPNFPESSFTYNDLSPEDKERGDAAATAAGYTPGTFEFESAAFDFAITNDAGFLEGVDSDPEVVEQVTTFVSPANFIGADIQLERFFPNLDTLVEDATIATVGNGVEFNRASSDSDPTTPGFVGGYNIDITRNSIVYETVPSPTNSPTSNFNDADFNGFLFTDISNTLPAITNVTIDSSATNFDVEASDITFTEDTISINFEGISYTPGEIVKLDVTFANSSDDAYEENDIQADAYDLSNFENTWLSNIAGNAQQFDDDWYQIIVAPGNQLVTVDLEFSHAEGDIDVAIYNANQEFIASATSITDNELLETTVPTPGDYYLRVYFDDLGNSYDLRWDTETFPLVDDAYEENDELLGAYNLSNQEQTWLEDLSGLGISNDEDWYQINITEGYENLVVDLRFEDDAGDLDISVYDADGNYILGALSVTDNEFIDTILPSSGTYYLQVEVYLEYTGNTYDLWWDDLEV